VNGAATPAGRLRSLPRLPHVGDRARVLLASRRLRRRLLVATAALLLLGAGYQFWLRDSSFVAVEKVTVTGLSTSHSERVRMALTAASRSMTTLHVDHEALERAVAGFPVVRELEVTTDFPHGLSIHVVEHVPAAVAVGDGGRVPVAADGTILQGVPVERRLPSVEVEGALGVQHLRDATALASAAIAGAAPAALRGRISEVGVDGRLGQVAQLREGPEVIFGDATRLHAKWAAASRVLADLEASGASYVDVRIPGRPAAGGLPAETIVPVAPAGATSTVPPGTTAGAGTAVDPAAAGTLPPADPTLPPAAGTVPPAAGTVPPATTAPAPGTVTQTTTTPPAPTTSPAPATPVPAPAAPLTDSTGGGAAAAPSP
jgi:cell division protein FtsQ